MFSLMSGNAPSNENGRFDEIFSKRVNVHGFDDFDEFSPFSLLHAFLNISRIFFTQNVCFRQKEPTEDENEGDKRQSND